MLGFRSAPPVTKTALAVCAAVTASGTLLASASPAGAVPEYFKTTGTNVIIRKCPDLYNDICSPVKTLKAKGTSVHAICWTVGSSVGGDKYWYFVDSPTQGYVAGYWVNSGTDPNKNVTACKS